MEEVSSAESFHTETGELSSEKPETPKDASSKEQESEQNITEKENSSKKDDKDDDNETNDANIEEEFEQISDGTFEVDENSQATSTGLGVTNDEDSTKATPSTKNDKEVVDEEEEEKSPDNENSREPGAASTDFENVDANVSANSLGASESDVLGQADMTISSEKDADDENAQDGQTANAMEVDELADAVGDEENDESMGNDAIESAKDDVEMASPETVDKTVEESMEATEKKSMETALKSSKESEAVKTADESMDAEVENKEEDKKDDVEKVVTEEESTEKDEDVQDAEDNTEKKVVTAEDEKDIEDTEKDAEDVVRDREVEKDTEDVEKDSEDVEKDMETIDDVDGETEDGEKDNDVDAQDVDGAEEDIEAEDQSIENVQEPEESDVCLIPDDTETEMTQAEKDQAILARENAEKEADAAEAQKEQEKEASKSMEEDIENENDASDNGVNANAGDNAQAGEAGAESAAADAGEETPPNTEAGDPDEPLLEELQSSTTEAGAPSKVIVSWIVTSMQKCSQCKLERECGFRYKNIEKSTPDAIVYEFVCEQSCCDELQAAQPGKFFIRRKKFLVEEFVAEGETAPADSNNFKCMQCKESKQCKYFFRQDDETFYVCNDDCFNLLNAEEPEKFKLKRHSIRVRNIGATISGTTSESTNEVGTKKSTESRVVARTTAEAEAARLDRNASFVRRCAECSEEIVIGEKNLAWETLDFCNEICLGKYQRTIGSSCQTCHGEVLHQALGKYCVRFGFDIRQFCCAVCLNEFKKGLKTCSCCQKDISSGAEGFLAPVGDKEQFKDFCSQSCMRRYDAMCNPKKKARADTCAVCNNDKPVRVEILLDEKEHTFCSNPCFSAFKFVSNIVADQCGMCSKYFERKCADSYSIYTDRRPKVFCSRICLNVFIINNRRIVSCQWCKVKKYNFDMIYKQHDSQEVLMCSLNCLTLYGVSINAFSRTVAKCDNCNASSTPQYHLTMSDASMRNFCTYQCVMQFQSQFARAPLTLESEPTAANTQQSSVSKANDKNNTAPFPTGLPKRVKVKGHQQKGVSSPAKSSQSQSSSLPVISTVSSLASGETMIGNVTVRRSRVRGGRKLDSPPPLVALSPLNAASNNQSSSLRARQRKTVDYSRSPSPTNSTTTAGSVGVAGGVGGKRNNSTGAITPTLKVPAETKIIAVPPYPPLVRNVQTSCKPQTVTVGFQCEPKTATKEIQTEKDYSNKILIPVPVPIFIPQPIYMYSAPFPVPVPIPLPIPVPVFIPTTRNSANGIMKEIKKIQDKMPADPFEAELLMMAEMVAEEKHVSDSDSDDEIKPDPSIVQMEFQNNVQQVEVANHSYGEDVLQMALKMATGEYDQAPQHTSVDLESAMTANTITNPPPGMAHSHDMHNMATAHHLQQTQHIVESTRGGRGRKRGSITSPGSPRNSRSPVKRPRLHEIESQSTPEPIQPTEKPDANLCLKYTFGVNAWKQWVMTKNADLEKSSMRKRLFKTELLQMTADELNYSLCLFVKEVRKPNGSEYAPDTIYYLVLGIQQYLYENGRIDNIFTDPYYERFTDCLDEVARKFSVLYNDSQYIVTRVEEEHLWECKQLGAHSPHVLLSTLMFFNTKHFNLTSVEEHMQLSFSHIMKHWKRSAQNAKTPGARNVLLRFYPPQAGLDANPRKKKVYEQQENEENPLRCPVRLYEFYLSKCPESVKTRNDVFYLQPERSCVPDSPVWYSTQALSQDSLQKMLHRVKMVKEINIALLTS